jgi:CP family cyanate transporter-like MFS transporter
LNTEEQYRLPGKVLAIALLLAFGIFMPLLVIPPLEDVISRELAISHAGAALLYSLPVAMLALVAIPSGFLADTIGLKKSIGIGAMILTAGSALRGISTNYSIVLVFTLLYGIGLGLCFPNIPKLARHCSPREKSHFTISMFTVGILASGAIALAIASPVIYPLTNSFRGVFLISTVPIFVAVCLWWPLINDPPCQTAGVEAVGADWAALRKVMARTDLWLVSILFLLHNFVLYTFAGWLPQFLVSIGASQNAAGLITSVMFWVGLPSVILLSRLSTSLGMRKPFLWGPSILLIFTMYGVLLVNVPLSWLLVVFAGIATTIRFSTILSLPVEMVNPNLSGSASGMIMSVGYIGALIGPLIGGIILDKIGTYQWVFLSLVIVSVLTVGVAFIVPETGKSQPD